MKKSKKFIAAVLAVLMIMSAFSVAGFAAESECSEHNVYRDYIDGTWYEICDNCGYKECSCESYGYDYAYKKAYTYKVCFNCGKETVYCDHSEYDFVDGDPYYIYCDVTETCHCGQAVISGTKHELGEYVTEDYSGYFICSLCGDSIFLYQLEDNELYDNGDGTYSGEWVSYDDETGTIVGSGKAYIDKDGVLTVSGEGFCKFNFGFSDFYDNGNRYVDIDSIIKKVIIEEGITEVKELGDVNFFSEIKLPQSLKKIDYSVIAPKAIINIPENCFVNGTIIAKEINLHKNNPYYTIDENGFLYSKDMTVLYRYNGTEKEVSIPEGVKEISMFAFLGNKYIEKVNIPSSVKTIGDEAFLGCGNLKNVSLSSGLEKIGEGVFTACLSLEEVIIPDTVTEIGDDAFANCYSLKYVQLSENLKEIPKYAFEKCLNLKTINIPLGVEKIGVGAFVDCIALEEINIYSASTDLSESELGLIVEMRAGEKEEYFELLKEMVKISVEAHIYPEEYDEEKFSGSYMGYLNYKMDQLAVKMNEFYDQGRYTPIPSDILTIYCNEGSTAEAYAIEKGIKYVANSCEHSYGEWVTDEENSIKYKVCEKCGKTFEEEITEGGIVVESPEDDGKNKFSIEYIDNPENTEYIYVRGLVDGNIVGLYDINLIDENGNKVQPDGKVKISLPLESDVLYFTVLRINDDGSVTDMNAVREGDYAVFETDHFSYYVIVGGETEKDTGDNIKCECLCHTLPILEFIFNILKLLARLLDAPIEFPCSC